MYFIGLGLGDEKDVTIKGKEAIERSSRVYLEAYTSVLGGGGGASGLNKENMVPPTRSLLPPRRQRARSSPPHSPALALMIQPLIFENRTARRNTFM